MTEIPQAVLSEHFQERMKGRRLVAAIFTTFRLEPAFFETQVLPVFLDIPLSHAEKIKLVQLEEALVGLSGRVALYYDNNGLVPDGGAAKLDVRRIPIRHPTGIFHPKNVLALVEAAEPDKDGHFARALLCGCASANLTRAGWWENVEVAHVEEIAEGEHTALRTPLLRYVDGLVRAAEGRRANDDLRAAHGAAAQIREFLRGTSQREHRSVAGKLLTHFHDGEASLPDFIEQVAGNSLRGLCLEIVSPYFDGAEASAPLEALLERFEPEETRVYLPRNDAGEALCSEGLFAWLRRQDGVAWGALPNDILARGKGKDVKQRNVHAKIYRFFEPKRGGREVLYVGSTNLTTAGCRVAGRGGNWETGFLVEVTGTRRPEWWLANDTKRPTSFAPREESEGTASGGGTPLMLRFHWDTQEASALWTDQSAAPPLDVQHGGVTVLRIDRLEPRVWQVLDPSQSTALRETLRSTSLLTVVTEGRAPATLLVQEEGMSRRPSLLHELSAAEILRYWALLTIEQRCAFIEAHSKIAGDDDPLIASLAPLPVQSTLFDRFAGIFHAFECLEERVRTALQDNRLAEADYRLFGKKYDALGSLVDRVLDEATKGTGDRVEQYVVTLCAKQLLDQVGRDFPDYWTERARDVAALTQRLGDAALLRDAIAQSDAEMPAFLEWFERWFLRRAARVEEEPE